MLRRIVQVRSHEYLQAGWHKKAFGEAGVQLTNSVLVAGMNFIESLPPVPNANKAEMFAAGATSMTRGSKPQRPSARTFNIAAAFEDEEAIARLKFERRDEVIDVYADLEIEPLVTVNPGLKTIGTDADVARLLCVPQLQALGLTGKGSRIVIVDTGVDKSVVPVDDEGWSPEDVAYEPGSADATDPLFGHGTMCAFDARIAASLATFHDFALLRRIGGGLSTFLSDVLGAYGHLADLLEGSWAGQAVIVNNSWAVYNRNADLPVGTPGNYSANMNHPVNQQIGALASLGADIVFAAGNCGNPNPDGRCGAKDCGPGKSVHGANSHPDVTSVAGATIDARRLAYSSQGPGAISSRKPDVACYTHFAAGPAGALHSGTSAASPVLAGLLAALRTRGNAKTMSPTTLRSLLVNATVNPTGTGWNGDFGHGIVDVMRLLGDLGLPVAPMPAMTAGSKAKQKKAKKRALKKSKPTRKRSTKKKK